MPHAFGSEIAVLPLTRAGIVEHVIAGAVTQPICPDASGPPEPMTASRTGEECLVG
jgi:hypothetical protein